MQLFDEDIAEVLEWESAKSGGRLGNRMKTALSKMIADNGISMAKMKEFVSEYIDEDKVRNSGYDVGLVTYSLSDRKPHELFIEDIAEGKLMDYLMASCNLPVFKTQVIDDKKFIDGFVYDNWPVNMLINKNYDEIIAVRTNSRGAIRAYDKNATHVTVISPSAVLTNSLAFSSQNSATDIQIGYFDGLRAICGLKGQYYYLRNVDMSAIIQNLITLDYEALTNLPAFVKRNNQKPGNRLLLEYGIPELAKHFKLEKNYTYEDVLTVIFEYAAYKRGISRYKIYEFNEFIKLIYETNKPSHDTTFIEWFTMSSDREDFIEILVKTLLG